MHFATLLEKYCFEHYVLEIAIATLQKGVTASEKL